MIRSQLGKGILEEELKSTISTTSQRVGRVLLISPSFFGYELEIVSSFERLGFQVDFHDERPSNGSFSKAALRLNPKLMATRVRRHYARVSRAALDHVYDFVVVVKGEVVPECFLASLRATQVRARFIFYTFDSITNSSNCVALFPYFHDLFSFDSIDVRSDPRLRYKPLFYSTPFTPGALSLERKFDAAFIGTLHSDRFAYIQHLLTVFEKPFVFFYVPARWFFLTNRYITGRFRGVPRSSVSFTPMTSSQVAEIFRSSRVVFDLQRAQQSGLTMRTFEALASGAILVTANQFIRNAEFFDSRYIVIVKSTADAALAKDLKHTLDRNEQVEGPPPGFDKYSIDAWSAHLLGITPDASLVENLLPQG